jgi:ABC-type dipeptide/oligopeptide/nickel transport system permease subunit
MGGSIRGYGLTDLRDPTPLLAPDVGADAALQPVGLLGVEPLGTPLQRPWRLVLRRFARQRLALASLLALAIVSVVALVGGRVWHYHYADITPEFSTPPSAAHPMGTDSIGHDELAQVLRGAQKSLQVGLIAAAVSTFLGAAVGATAGYYRGKIDAVLMRFTDAVLTVPGIAILIVMAGRFRASAGNWLAIALIIAALSWTGIARIVRGMVLSLREQSFVEAARAVGARDRRIIFRHLLPHAIGPIIVKATFAVGGAIFAETGLSYLGLGISPPDTSLGSLVASGQSAVTTRPWLFWFPGLVIVVIVLSLSLVGDGLRDALAPAQDMPRARRRRWLARRATPSR